MTQKIDPDGLAAIIRDRGRQGRCICAIAGPPGAGKSTLAEELVARLNRDEPGSAAILPMDGYHYDDMVLVPAGLRPRKGAPETFDIGGFGHMLGRLKRNTEAEIAVPVFDRSIEIARAGARLIPQSVRYIIAEGNYLLLDIAGWRDLQAHYDITALVAVPEEELRARLGRRWAGLPPEDLAFKLEGNDLPNGRLVMNQGVAPEYVLE